MVPFPPGFIFLVQEKDFIGMQALLSNTKALIPEVSPLRLPALPDDAQPCVISTLPLVRMDRAYIRGNPAK